MDIKNIIIFLIIFFVIQWLQHNDDKKFNKTEKRISLYDKIKIPIVASLFVILIKELDLNKCTEFVYSVFLINSPSIKNNDDINFLNNNFSNNIYIDPPDF